MAGCCLDGVPAEAAKAARDTLGGAVGAAGQLPGHTGTVLLDAARDAFTQGLHFAFGISATASLGVAVLAALLLKAPHERHQPEPEAEPAAPDR